MRTHLQSINSFCYQTITIRSVNIVSLALCELKRKKFITNDTKTYAKSINI